MDKTFLEDCWVGMDDQGIYKNIQNSIQCARKDQNHLERYIVNHYILPVFWHENIRIIISCKKGSRNKKKILYEIHNCTYWKIKEWK